VDDREPRAAILSAARDVLGHNRQATIDDLAQAAGVSRATVYRLFGSREEILKKAGLEPDRDSRERVLAAAADLVGRDGLARLSMDELAAAAGLSRASLYRLFPGKPALFRELVRAYSPLETVAAIIEESRERPPEEVMPELARRAARVLEGRTGIVRTLLFELLGASPDSNEAADWAFLGGVLAVAGYMAEQMQLGRLRPMHPVVALTGFVGPVLLHLLGRALLERELGYDVPVEDTVTQLAENWVRSMRPE
jgi:TetR/AcrR family transcriptional regulator, mexJK operon transcriptional repressor